jgi:hypothetical protein
MKQKGALTSATPPPFVYFMSFTNPGFPLTVLVIVHIFYINKTTSLSPLLSLSLSLSMYI